MKAMVFVATSKLEMQDVPESPPSAGEALIDVAAAGICGSELHGIQHPGFRSPPLIMGHEFSGTTPDGRRVAINPVVVCGRCDLCKRGLTNLCMERSVIGIHRPGGFAERVAVPESNLHEIPAEMSWETAAMIEPLANAVHAWNLAVAAAPNRVGIIGAGAIGLVALSVALQNQAGEVAVADLSAERLAFATKLGATQTGPSLEGEFDVIFEAVGIEATKRASVEHLRRGGVAVWLGLVDPQPGFDSQDLIRSEKKVLGSFAYTDFEFSEAVNLATEVDLSWGQSFPLDHGVDIFMELMHGRTDVAKALLRP